MNYESLKDILSNAKNHGWSAENVSFGSGGEGIILLVSVKAICDAVHDTFITLVHVALVIVYLGFFFI